MKKLMIAFLVLAATFVYAQDTQLADVTFADHMFTINTNGTMHIQMYQPETTLGHGEIFGYIIESADGTTRSDILAVNYHSDEYDKLTGNAPFDIENLKAGDNVVFYVKPTTDSAQLTDFDEFKGDHDGDPNYSAISWDKGNGHENHGMAFLQASFTADGNPAASGQPLPGALTTMLVASGCAAYLRKRKAARK